MNTASDQNLRASHEGLIVQLLLLLRTVSQLVVSAQDPDDPVAELRQYQKR